MGRRFDEVTEETTHWSYKVVKGDNTNTVRSISTDACTLPQEISAMVLQKMKKPRKTTGQEVSEAVITVPAYFNDAPAPGYQGKPVKLQLTVRRIVNEPTAAALAYGLTKRKKTRRSLCSTWEAEL